MTFIEAIAAVEAKTSLTRSQAREAFTWLMEGKATPAQIAALLMGLRAKGETVEELAGAAESMRQAAIPVSHSFQVLVDTCGTGGDGTKSFNVSTAAAFVVAGAGFSVAKHGNRSVSSQCGSADVLEELGIPVETSAAVAGRCLREAHIAFLFAPAFHPAMKHAMPVRRELGVRTIFNLLGPLTNPARPTVQLVGVYAPEWVEPLARVLAELGCRQGAVVHGQGFDEVALSGPTTVAEIRDGKVQLLEWSPEDFGLTRQPAGRLAGGSRQQNAKIIMDLIEGKASPYRDAVCMNAAAAMAAAFRLQGAPKSLKNAFRLAQESIDGQKALQALRRLKECLREDAERHG